VGAAKKALVKKTSRAVARSPKARAQTKRAVGKGARR
jgi:hypothetical protein